MLKTASRASFVANPRMYCNNFRGKQPSNITDKVKNVDYKCIYKLFTKTKCAYKLFS